MPHSPDLLTAARIDEEDSNDETHHHHPHPPVKHLCALAVCWVVLLIAATTSAAATATFSASLEAERHSQWDQPRGVNLIDCHGQHYYAVHGEDQASIKTRNPFKVIVTRVGRSSFWQFGPLPNAHDPGAYGIEAHGVSTRSLTVTSGTTGG